MARSSDYEPNPPSKETLRQIELAQQPLIHSDWSWEAFSDLGPEARIEVIYDSGLFTGSARWCDENGNDVKVSLGFDEAANDEDFDAFMDELYAKALEAKGNRDG